MSRKEEIAMQNIIISAIAIFTAIIAHEIAHGWVAWKLGDDTAQKAGRLSVNPIRHIDIIGTLLVPFFLIASKIGIVFGWAKPVPVDYTKLKHEKRDIILVSAAGISANFVLALLSALLLKLSLWLPFQTLSGLLSMFWLNMIIFNVILALFNLIPIPPLDGSKILLGWSKNPYIIRFLNAERTGLIFIILFAFILPVILQKFDIYFNPLASYLRNTTLWLASWLI